MPCVRIAVPPPPALSSSAVNSRPRAADTPSIGSRDDDTRTAPTRSGSPSPVRFAMVPIASPSCSNPRWPFLMSKYCAVENQSSAMPRPGERFQSTVSRSASAYGTGLSSRAFRTLKIAVVAPRPSAIERIAAAANPRLEARARTARLASPAASVRKARRLQRHRAFTISEIKATRREGWTGLRRKVAPNRAASATSTGSSKPLVTMTEGAGSSVAA